MIISVTIQTQDAGEAERALQDLAKRIHEAAEKTGKLQPCFGRYATNAGDGRFEIREEWPGVDYLKTPNFGVSTLKAKEAARADFDRLYPETAEKKGL